MSDFIGELRLAQAACAETMLIPFWAHVGLVIAAEPARFGEYLEPVVANGVPLDPDAVRLTYEKDAEHQLTKAIEGYVDWAAARIVRNGDFEPIDLPIPSIVDSLAITGEYGVKPALLRFVIEQLREELVIPLLGRMTDGFLVPDEAALKEWASHYDWGDLDATA